MPRSAWLNLNRFPGGDDGMDESANSGENVEIRAFEKLKFEKLQFEKLREGIDLYRSKNWDKALKEFRSKALQVFE
jgi:hypothetical protein